MWRDHSPKLCCWISTLRLNIRIISIPGTDTGGGNGGNYSFAENATSGVAGSRGVSVLNNNDTTAAFKSGSWNLSTNGATVLVSILIYTDGQTSGDKVQLGIMNTNANGLNNNTGVAFESFRFVPQSATSWQLFEQARSGNALATSASLGTVSVIANHWYKFVVAVTNTSGASGNLSAGCALYDYGNDGLTPGANLIMFLNRGESRGAKHRNEYRGLARATGISGCRSQRVGQFFGVHQQ